MVEAIKFESAVVTRPYFQDFLKIIREPGQVERGFRIYRLVDGYDITLKDELIIKARGKNRGYFIMANPNWVKPFRLESNGN